VFDRSPYELGASFGASPRCSAIRVDAVCAPEHELPVLIPYNKTCVIDVVHPGPDVHRGWAPDINHPLKWFPTR